MYELFIEVGPLHWICTFIEVLKCRKLTVYWVNNKDIMNNLGYTESIIKKNNYYSYINNNKYSKTEKKYFLLFVDL